MTVKLANKPVVLVERQTIEHDLTIDGVIELPESCEAEEFFDGLLDAIIDYVEQHDGFAALGMKHKKYEESEADNDEVEYGGKGA
ncbi:MAG TPA: hypothetical protein PLD25_20795 [Chloroflexota bacterium]|nr:hypothetical protein [Chloroflexota bacterium]HUM67966.1 hypothetical protein [Chloroflexota bacterium]